jgi:hypothetical protein
MQSNLAMEDLKLVDKLSHGKVDLTFGRQVHTSTIDFR